MIDPRRRSTIDGTSAAMSNNGARTLTASISSTTAARLDTVDTDASLIDAILAVNLRAPLLLIAGLILYSSFGVLRESATVLLEGTPMGMDMPAVVDAIKNVGGVLDVHDLHVWMVGPGVVACSCHILVAEQSVREGQQVLRAVVQDIEHRFHITHTTVQVEVEGCDATDMYCMGQRSLKT